MAAVRRKKKSQVRQRQRNRTQSRRGGPTRRRTTGRRVNRSLGKKRSAGRNSRKPAGRNSRKPAGRNSRKALNLQFDSVRMTNDAQNILHFCVHDLYKKVSLAAERLRKKKRHVSITVSDVKNALKKIMPGKYDGKSVSSISYKCH